MSEKIKGWPIRGVRVDGDKVIVSVKGGNDAARWLCGELLAAVQTPPAHQDNIAGTRMFVNESGRLEMQYLTRDEVYLSPAPEPISMEPTYVDCTWYGYKSDNVRSQSWNQEYGMDYEAFLLEFGKEWVTNENLKPESVKFHYSAEQLATLQAKLEQEVAKSSQLEKDKAELQLRFDGLKKAVITEIIHCADEHSVGLLKTAIAKYEVKP